MNSPGLKRPLDLEMIPHKSGLSSSAPVAGNGSKRRCTTNFSPQTRADNSSQISHNSFKDPSALLTPLSEEIASMIKDEINKSHDAHCKNEDPPVLTIRQAQTICEKLIKDREQRLREDYDRMLACKVAEQYDLLAKANYLNSYVESRIPSTLTPPTNTPSINALAAAFTSMQRSTQAAANSTQPMPSLSNFAASLSANGHSNALSNPHMAYNLQQQAAAAAAAAAALQAQQQRVPTNTGPVPTGPVLLASNLDEQLATPEALFTLFGVFGDVVRVKILFNKKDNALVQMADANQAQVAQGYLDKQKVFGKVIRVTRSKHQLVQMPREGNQSDVGLTKDFTNSPLHRFKIPGSRNCLNIYPPSNTLHISNIPTNIEEGDIHKAFKDACKFEFSSFKFFQQTQPTNQTKDRKMALIRFDSIENATIALIKMHNYPISGDNNLRVSFSKSQQ